MRRCLYQVAVGPQRPLWERCIESVSRYAERHALEHRVQREPLLRIVPGPPRVGARAPALGYLAVLEKFAAWDLLGEYDEILLLDADVYAKPDAPSIFDYGPTDKAVPLAGVVERSMPITVEYWRKLDAYAQGQYGHPHYPFINCGVMLLYGHLWNFTTERGARAFLSRPEHQPMINGEGAYRWSTEQTMVNKWLDRVGCGRLDWKWNALYGVLKPGSLDHAQFVHFFLSDHLSSDDPVEMLATGAGRLRI